MITQRDLVQRLSRTGLGAWSVVERVQDIAIADDHRSLQRRDRRTRLTLIVHHDVPRGRGSARLDIDAYDGSTNDLIEQATALALAAVGPAWSSAPPAAPAKVTVVDEDLLKRELDAVALGTLTRLRRPPDITVTATIEVLRERITVFASSGFRTSWPATTLRATALLSTSSPSPSTDRTLTLSREARRTDDFDLDAAIADAASDLLLISTASRPTPGRCVLWLGPEALLHGDASDDGHDHGLWTIFAQQANSALERQGLTRYRWRSEISPGASQLPEPLSIRSLGALDFATRSTPVSDDAVAIRNFPLIDRGIAVGLGLSPREAALRQTDPNGGVRNLVIDGGSWSPAPSTTTRTIEVRRLHSHSSAPYTGNAILDIALAFDHHPNRPSPTPFTGGTLHLDLVTTLSRARRSSQLLRRGAYHGPIAILIDDAELLA
jgi:predicted Zn-dependent protease